jgi:hypothetical protein
LNLFQFHLTFDDSVRPAENNTIDCTISIENVILPDSTALKMVQDISKVMSKIDEILQAKVEILEKMLADAKLEKPKTTLRSDTQSILIRNILLAEQSSPSSDSWNTATEIESIKKHLDLIGKQVIQLTNTVTASLPPAEFQKEQKANTETLQKAIKTLETTNRTWAAVASQPERSLTALSQRTPKDIREVVRSSLIEHQIETERKRNVIVFGLHEGSSVTDDLDTFKTLCLSELDCSINPIACRRIGQKSNDKVRPLLVQCVNEADRRRLLGNAKLLRQSSDEHVKRSIFIAPDMSKEEREKQKKLREEKRAQYKHRGGIGETVNHTDPKN